ncbi:hypothetical protein A6R79_17535 [Xanthomonas translucens pv. translucens]|nr:hypothetical protein A6R79_17535 [Xanthomonas translucens pv. translucens]
MQRRQQRRAEHAIVVIGHQIEAAHAQAAAQVAAADVRVRAGYGDIEETPVVGQPVRHDLIDREQATPLMGRADLEPGHHRRRQAAVEQLHIAGGYRVVQAHADRGEAGGLVVAAVQRQAVLVDAADAAIRIGNAAFIDHPRQQWHLACAAAEAFHVVGDPGVGVGLEDFLGLPCQFFIHFLGTEQAGSPGRAVERFSKKIVLGAGAFDVFVVDLFYARLS